MEAGLLRAAVWTDGVHRRRAFSPSMGTAALGPCSRARCLRTSVRRQPVPGRTSVVDHRIHAALTLCGISSRVLYELHYRPTCCCLA